MKVKWDPRKVRFSPGNLSVGARVKGSYYGKKFNGRIKHSPVGGISIDLSKPIDVLGDKNRTGLWFDGRTDMTDDHYFELA